MARTRSSIRRPKIACTPPSPSWPSPWPISPSNMRRSVAFQAAMPPFLGACFGGAGLSLPIRAKLGLFLAPILQGFLCAFLCVLSGNPSAPHRRPPSSAVSALVLSLTAPLLCADLRVSAPPRQNHTLRFPSPFHHDPVRGIGPSLRPVALRGTHSARASAFSRSSYPPAGLLRPILPDSCERNTWRIHRRPESPASPPASAASVRSMPGRRRPMPPSPGRSYRRPPHPALT